MDDLNLTMKEYIKLEAKKVCRRDSGIDGNIDTQSHEFNKDFKTNHDILRESTNMEDYLIIVKVVIQKHFQEGLPFIFMIKNLYVSFGIPFDPKWFYKDGGYMMKLRRPRQVNRVHVLDFEGLTEDMSQGFTNRLRMVYIRAEGHVLFTIHAWRRLFEV
nr:hypothetical protein [Tanacetum cinerariifolium]